jgi:C4-dicarboxylate-specific signal transduction histidine kinase
VKIKDTGCGIKEPEKIFFAGYTTKGVGVGTGLGLAISQKIIEKHEGKIEVNIGNFAIAKVITAEQMSANAQNLRYIGTDYEALYNGSEVWANVYEDENNGELFATIEQ